MQIEQMPVYKYMQMTNYALKLFQDTLDSEKSDKGNILLYVLSSQLATEIKRGNLNPQDDSMEFLIKIYSEFGFCFYQPKISNFLKLAHNVCEGNYQYIYSRF